MKHISPERKIMVLPKLLPPYNMPITTVAQMDRISKATLYPQKSGVDYYLCNEILKKYQAFNTKVRNRLN